MNTRPHPSSPNPPASGHHLATISHDGRFWEVYLEFEEDPRSPTVFRARLCFLPGDPGEGEAEVRTAVIIIESSFEEAMLKARSLDDRNLQSLLRSALPD